MDVRFVINLRADTATAAFVEGLQPRGWLAAAENISCALRSAIPELIKNNRWMVADNGNYDQVGSITGIHAAEGARLCAALQAEIERLGRTPSRSALPTSLRDGIDALTNTSSAQAGAALGGAAGEDARLAAQLAVTPTHLIGVEDLSCAVWLRLGIPPELLPVDRTAYRRINTAVSRRAAAVRDRLPSSLSDRYYPVASALTYDGAFDAGRVFAADGHQRIAMGFGSYMADDTWTDHYRIGRKVVRPPRRFPNRYLRTALVARGFFDGYSAEVGRPPEGFHFLGLGAPIMMAVVTRAALGVREVSFDAMSPIKDAVEATLYVNRPAYLKIPTWRFAGSLGTPSHERWNCPCPFCQVFLEQHPFNYAELRHQVVALARPVVVNDLRPEGALFSLAPLLAEPSGTPLRGEVSAARMSHNHWVLNGICRDLTHAARSESGLEWLLAKIVADYRRSTNSKAFGDAVAWSAAIANGHLWG